MDAWTDRWINRGVKEKRERGPQPVLSTLRRKENKRQKEAVPLPTSFVYSINLSLSCCYRAVCGEDKCGTDTSSRW